MGFDVEIFTFLGQSHSRILKYVFLWLILLIYVDNCLFWFQTQFCYQYFSSFNLRDNYRNECFLRTGPDTLARRLIDNPSIRTFKLLEKRKMKLEGHELDEHYRLKREEEKHILQRIKKEWVFILHPLGLEEKDTPHILSTCCKRWLKWL